MSERRVALSVRQTRIEYLQTRAAYEREALSFHTGLLGRELSPKRWLGGLWHSNRTEASSGRVTMVSILSQGLSMAAQYPYLTAAVSSMFVGKRWRWVKLAGIGIGIWRAYVGSNTHQR